MSIVRIIIISFPMSRSIQNILTSQSFVRVFCSENSSMTYGQYFSPRRRIKSHVFSVSQMVVLDKVKPLKF